VNALVEETREPGHPLRGALKTKFLRDTPRVRTVAPAEAMRVRAELVPGILGVISGVAAIGQVKRVIGVVLMVLN
jgi:hypothetical protein